MKEEIKVKLAIILTATDKPNRSIGRIRVNGVSILKKVEKFGRGKRNHAPPNPLHGRHVLWVVILGERTTKRETTFLKP